MPVFKALAGLSPNCWAVLVQMEHWASTSPGSRQTIKSTINKIAHPLAITLILQHKNTTKRIDAKKSVPPVRRNGLRTSNHLNGVLSIGLDQGLGGFCFACTKLPGFSGTVIAKQYEMIN
jgi:hypothetical protein